jgi:hypothetical protein
MAEDRMRRIIPTPLNRRVDTGLELSPFGMLVDYRT